MSATFTIPSNVKQSSAPFQLNPNKEINVIKSKSDELKGAKPQLFSFRTEHEKQFEGAFGKLNICPSSYAAYINNDVSFQHIFPYIRTSGTVTKDTTNLDHIMNCIPGIQIREFLPDTRLDQALNFMTDMMEKLKSIFVKDKDDKETSRNMSPEEKAKLKAQQEQETKSFFTKLTEICSWAVNYLTGANPDPEESLMEDIKKILKTNGAVGIYSAYDEKLKNYILNFPYILYYRFQSCVTTNLYELPCSMTELYSSDGHAGWDEGGKLELVNTFVANIPMVGPLVKSILGNIRVNYLPWWDSSPGHGTPEPDVTITFDLYNDTYDAAIINFIFVNTIIPNNKWIQYNIFQHSSSLYDVKIEGHNRLFACSANFAVKAKGKLRDVPQQMLHDLGNKYSNIAMKGKFEAEALLHRLVKIPDVYEVTMTFRSLLPTNFNQFLFTYSQNKQIIDSPSGYQSSVAVDMLSGGIKAFGDKAKKKWDELNGAGK